MDDLTRTMDPSAPERSLGYRLWMLRHAWTRRVEAVLAPSRLTHMQFFVLRAIEHVGATGAIPSQTQLADFLTVDRMTVSKVVRTLESRGVVARGVHPEDPRANSVELTAEGRRLLGRATELVLTEQNRFFGRIGPEMKALFETLVDQLLDPETLGDPGPQTQMECP